MTAQNTSGATTTNYKGALWKVAAGNVSRPYAAVPARHERGRQPVGRRQRRRNRNDQHQCGRQAVIHAQHADNGNISATAPVVFNAIAFDSGNAFRFGVLHLTPAYGSDLLDLPVQVEARYWDGVRMAPNSADQCTALPTAAAMGNYQGHLAACETAIASSTLTLANGRAFLKLARPGNGNNGSVDLALQLGAMAAGQTCSVVGAPPARRVRRTCRGCKANGAAPRPSIRTRWRAPASASTARASSTSAKAIEALSPTGFPVSDRD